MSTRQPHVYDFIVLANAGDVDCEPRIDWSKVKCKFVTPDEVRCGALEGVRGRRAIMYTGVEIDEGIASVLAAATMNSDFGKKYQTEYQVGEAD
jgi:hypothetical protein